MAFEKMSEEISSKLSSCETPEELLKMASEYGVVFSEEELSMINGGSDNFQTAKDYMLGRIDRDYMKKSIIY